MRSQKKYADLYSVEDWIGYFQGASKAELKAAIKLVGTPRTETERNKIKACVALLA